MRKIIKAIIWALWILISAPFRLKQTADSVRAEHENSFGFLGSDRKPFKNAILYEYDPETEILKEAIVLKGSAGEKRGFITKGAILVWSSNRKNAIKKLLKSHYNVVE